MVNKTTDNSSGNPQDTLKTKNHSKKIKDKVTLVRERGGGGGGTERERETERQREKETHTEKRDRQDNENYKSLDSKGIKKKPKKNTQEKLPKFPEKSNKNVSRCSDNSHLKRTSTFFSRLSRSYVFLYVIKTGERE